MAQIHWINGQLTSQNIRYEPKVPELIQQHTHGNLLACAQVIEKIILSYGAAEAVTLEQVKEQLIDQCDYQLYELADACLSCQLEKALRLLQKSSQDRTEPTLILWLMTQEIRLLIQLSSLLRQSVPLTTACNQLKIWPQRTKLYELTVKRLPTAHLQHLLFMCHQLDEGIKSNRNTQVWQGLEQLAIGLCQSNP